MQPDARPKVEPADARRAVAAPPLPAPSPRHPVEPPAPPAPRPRETAPAPAPPREEDAPAEPAVSANRTMKTGTNLVFHVTPPDAYVLLDRTVIGKAEDYNGQKGSRPYTLPGPGSYTVKLKKDGMRPYVIAVEASEGGGSTPVDVHLQPLPAADVETADLQSYRVREAVALRVQPDDATVAVDGRELGPAKRYAGRFGRADEWLQLSIGTHRVTLSAPGYQRRDLRVEVTAGAEQARQRIDVNLSRGGG